MTKSLSPSRIRFILNMLGIREAENGFELIGTEEAALQSRVIKICRVHKQVKAVVSHGDANMINMLQAFLVALQATRALSAENDANGNDDTNDYFQAILAAILQVFAYAAAFAENYPGFVSAAMQVVVICTVLCFASCLLRRQPQPSVSVNVSVNDGKFDRPLAPTPGGAAPGTPQVPLSCATSSEETSFDPDQWSQMLRARRECRGELSTEVQAAKQSAAQDIMVMTMTAVECQGHPVIIVSFLSLRVLGKVSVLEMKCGLQPTKDAVTTRSVVESCVRRTMLCQCRVPMLCTRATPHAECAGPDEPEFADSWMPTH
ncbi:unnamed protein product [Symbiodinium sp. CCMP2456]|nr:unnamed protein product [Symbiodinium sp. CCMP2456]